MAGEFDIPIWTASQANRSSLEEDVIGDCHKGCRRLFKSYDC